MIVLKFLFSEDQDSQRFGNIMYDRRVIRGNTYALHTLPAVRMSFWKKEKKIFYLKFFLSF
jgi:hypothetical protein